MMELTEHMKILFRGSALILICQQVNGVITMDYLIIIIMQWKKYYKIPVQNSLQIFLIKSWLQMKFLIWKTRKKLLTMLGFVDSQKLNRYQLIGLIILWLMSVLSKVISKTSRIQT